MNKELMAYKKTGYFSELMQDYLSGDEKLKTVYGNDFSIAGFKAQLEHKEFQENNRKVLVQALKEQYASEQLTTVVTKSFERLEESNTYTITTGHQLNLFTGPLYFIYKIVSAINLAKRLEEEFPDKHFVPVYWMATEDHDFEEIQFFNLFNKRHEIKKHTEGPVGRMKLKGIDEVFNTLSDTLANRTGLEDILGLLKSCYAEEHTFTQATRRFVNQLFGDYGLVIVDGDDAALKGLFKEQMKIELLNRQSEQHINTTSELLENIGYTKQVNPRAINLFYMEDGLRERIVFEDDSYRVLNTTKSFTQEELLKELEVAPEKFSPNVVLRPVYQEVILPNLAYIGGGGELAYWLQLKDNFEALDTTFPILMLRNSALLIDGGSQKKMNKLGLTTDDLFVSEHDLMKRYVKESADVDLELDSDQKKIEEVFKDIERIAEKIDASLKPMVGAELQKTLKAVQNIEKRLVKAEKQKEEVAINQIAGLKKKLFPNGSLQERYENFLYLYLILGPDFVTTLLQEFDPFSKEFLILLVE